MFEYKQAKPFINSKDMMLDLTILDNKKLAMIIVEHDAKGTETDWWVICGIAKWRDGSLFVNRGSDVPEFPIPDDTYDRIKLVEPQQKTLLQDAEFSIMLLAGPLPEGEDASTYISTGLNLPRDED